MTSICYTVPLLVAMFSQIRDATDPSLNREKSGRPTLGGKQYWTDEMVCHGWRIQRNVQFGQLRLLKPTNRVAQTGTYDHCRGTFDSVFRRPDFPPIPATVLVTVHGLGRTRESMSSIGQYVASRAEYAWINFGYASTREDITDHARALRNVLDELSSLKRQQDARLGPNGEPVGIEFHFVAHSLGNIVIRHMFSDIGRDETDRQRGAWRVGRMIMLGPPNQGSAMANLLKKSNVFRLVAGSTGRELGSEWNELQQHLVTPKFEFAIIAGGKGDRKGYNPLLVGDDDLIVRVEETKLSGAVDFAVVPSVHTYLMDRIESKQMTLRFLQNGYLKAADQRIQIP